MRAVEEPSVRPEATGRNQGAPVEPQGSARIRGLHRAKRPVRIPTCVRYEAYMQELAADYQRFISIGIEEGA